ncbi:hypothetical protein H6P81_001016 [Aristolochia fimbriata]|uniref:Uncharacterized protein n=1 Tax=Aristolochia fimbriata TaxID=158543 RepID=A0AAV7F694_ARIFI|nr:hypothetical protein H6P81_001016 [Aristolochia fimbriata]
MWRLTMKQKKLLVSDSEVDHYDTLGSFSSGSGFSFEPETESESDSASRSDDNNTHRIHLYRRQVLYIALRRPNLRARALATLRTPRLVTHSRQRGLPVALQHLTHTRATVSAADLTRDGSTASLIRDAASAGAYGRTLRLDGESDLSAMDEEELMMKGDPHEKEAEKQLETSTGHVGSSRGLCCIGDR